MHRAQDEVNINDYLTSYLKNYKKNFHMMLNLFESFLSDNENEILKQKIKKAKQSFQNLQQQAKQVILFKERANMKTIQRFCLRLNEYIQYRVGKGNGLVSEETKQELDLMSSDLHKFFSQIYSDKVQISEKMLKNVLSQISEIQSKYLVKILFKQAKIHRKSEKAGLITELLRYYIAVRERKNVEVQNGQALATESSISQKKIDFQSNFNESYFGAKIRSRRSTFDKKEEKPTTLSNNCSSISQKYPIELYLNQKINNVLESRGKWNQTQKLKKIVSKCDDRNTQCYKHIKDVVEIQSQSQSEVNKQDLMKCLLQNNKNNIRIIQKFRRKMKRIKIKFNKSEENIDKARHQRSITMNSSESKPNFNKQPRGFALPLLKLRNIKKS